MKNDLKRALDHQEYPLGTWISIGHPAVGEINAALGFDFVLIDSEHTTMSLETIEELVRAVEATSDTTAPVVRVPDNDPVRIKRVLDMGVSNIMVPMMNSVEEAESLVEAVKYPPDGIRGIAASRATRYGLDFDDYVDNADDGILTIVQIETKAGLRNAEEIAAVDGIDALFVGPADLSGSLGVFGQWDSEELNAAVDRVLSAGADADIPVGTLVVQPEAIEKHVEQGFDYLIAGKDATHLVEAGKETVERYEQATERYDEALQRETD